MLITEIFVTIDKIRQKLQEVLDVINSTLSKLPFFLGWIADRVRDGWNMFMGQMEKIWDWLTKITSNLGSADAVTHTADAWGNNIGGPVSQEVTNADLGLLMVDDNWAGSAANKYRQIVPLQKAALDKIKTNFTDGISTALSNFRTAITVYWGALIAALVAMVGGIVGALIAGETIIGLPAAPVILVGAAIAMLTALWAGSEILKSGASAANTVLRQKLNDSAAFPSGAWPTGVLH